MSHQATGNSHQAPNYLGAVIDENGRETPISDAMIENSLQALQDTPAEFICRLAQRAAS
ncbi:PA1571 family protein [Zhongshania sp.]|uniref:PA1571 family protein n=1 Tax=Zhongshania sp. TaxID=1971902 RepID=UPI003566A6FB